MRSRAKRPDPVPLVAAALAAIAFGILAGVMLGALICAVSAVPLVYYYLIVSFLVVLDLVHSPL